MKVLDICFNKTILAAVLRSSLKKRKAEAEAERSGETGELMELRSKREEERWK